MKLRHPPLFAPPPSRPREFPLRGSEPILPRGPSVGREPMLSPVLPGWRNPGCDMRALLCPILPRLPMFPPNAPRFSIAPRFTGEIPFRRMAFEIPACSRANEWDVIPADAPRVEKKCWLPPPLRSVPGAAGRPLALKLLRVGATGKFPVAKRAF